MKPTELRIGDPFVVTVEIANVSDKAVTFFYQDLYQAMKLEIRSDAGKVVKSQMLVVYDWPNPKRFYRRIEPGKTFTAEMKGRAKVQFATAADLAKDPATRAVMIDFHDVGFLAEGPGKFSATLHLSADEKTVEQGKHFGFDEVWTGELAGNAVAFSMRPMTREELDGFIAQVRFGKEDEQRAAIEVLSANADRNAVGALMGILTVGTEPHLRAAADALVRIHDTSVLPDLLALYRLRSKYGDERAGELQSILLNAIRGLQADQKKLGDLFIDVLKSDASVEARQTAAWNLAMSDHPQALEALIAAAKTHEPRMQYAAIDALTTLGHRRGKEKAVPPLIDILKTDPEGSVRGRAANALGQLGDKSAVPVLVEALKDPDQFVGSYAAHGLGMLGDAAAIPALEAYEKSAEKDSQKQAARRAIELIRQRTSARDR
jgi:HEAT repeat protein